MSRLTVAQAVEKMETRFIVRAAAVVLGFGMLILSITFIVWSTFFQSQTKVLSGINYYNFPVSVKMGTQVALLNAFDSYSFTTTDFGTIKLEVSDSSGKLISTRSHELTRSAGIAIDILSDKDSATQCFAQATVSNIFFLDTGGAQPVTEIKPLTDTGSNSFYLEVAAITDTTLYPGNYSGANLPATIDRQQKVWGLYPVDCNDIKDNDKLAQDVLALTEDKPEDQRQLYAQKVQQILASPEYNH